MRNAFASLHGGGANHNASQDPEVGTKKASITRSQHAVLTALNVNGFTTVPGFPMGPYPEVDSLLHALKSYCKDVKTSGGGHAIYKCGVVAPTSRRAQCYRFACAQCQSANKGLKENAPGWVRKWEVKYEETEHGFILSSAFLEHNHELITNEAEMQSRSSGRSIPPEYYEIGRLLAASTLHAADIDKVLRKKAHDSGLAVTWSYKDVWNAFAPTQEEKTLDAQGFLELLQDRETELGLHFLVSTDGEGRLDRAFVELPHGFDLWARGGDTNVLLFDPTHGTNRYKFKLASFVSVSSLGHSVILAYCIIAREDEPSFQWVWRAFAQVFRVAPLALFTDSDGAMRMAFIALSVVGQPWERTSHKLCIFHLSKNLYEHLHALFIGKVVEWREVTNRFWTIAKDSDRRSSAKFEETWNTFCNLVRATANQTDRKDRELEWLKNLGVNARQWAACFVWSTCTWTVHSTQRAESMQAAKKGFLSASMLLTQLDQAIVLFNESARTKKEGPEFSKAFRQFNSRGTFGRAVESLRGKITPFAMDLVTAQADQAPFYSASTEFDEDGCYTLKRDTGTATPCSIGLRDDGQIACHEDLADFGLHETVRDYEGRLTTLTQCSCQYITSTGLPCRHMLYLYTIQQVATIELTLIGEKWLVLTPAAESNKISKVRRMPIIPMVANGETASKDFSTNDLRALLNAEFRALSDVACYNESNFRHARLQLQALHLELITLAFPTRDAAKKTAPVRLDASRSAAADKTADGSVDKDEVSLFKILGLVSIPDHPPQEAALEPGSMEGKSLLGKKILVKWSNKGLGGWNVGEIKSQLSPPTPYHPVDMLDASEHGSDHPRPLGVIDPPSMKPKNFTVFYAKEGTTAEHILVMEKYSMDAVAPRHSWMLLKDRQDLNTLPLGGLQRVGLPEMRSKPGRPETARKRPVPGTPTSHSHTNRGSKSPKPNGPIKKQSHKKKTTASKIGS